MPAQTGNPLLHEVVAVVGGVKARSEQAVTSAYHTIQRANAFQGFARAYQRINDEDPDLPPESTLVQVRATDLMDRVGDALTAMFDVVATQDVANTHARADLVVEGTVLLRDLPVTYLMWLEKQVVLLRAFVAKLPVLDLAERWDWDVDARAWVTPPSVTAKPRKVRRAHVLYEATDKHPAQVEPYTEDQIVGYWSTVRYSGALPASHVAVLQKRIDTLVDAIRVAREQANAIEVEPVDAGRPIVAYLFGDVAT